MAILQQPAYYDCCYFNIQATDIDRGTNNARPLERTPPGWEDDYINCEVRSMFTDQLFLCHLIADYIGSLLFG